MDCVPNASFLSLLDRNSVRVRAGMFLKFLTLSFST
jgi:hypothetical protein